MFTIFNWPFPEITPG